MGADMAGRWIMLEWLRMGWWNEHAVLSQGLIRLPDGDLAAYIFW